jgi:hypothetical protein
MTLEEAVEIVLGADPWRTCPGCIGTGQFIGADGSFLCARCDGWGTILGDDYVAACVLLDKPLPRRGKPPVKARKVIFPTFEIDKSQGVNLEAYDLPLSKMLDDVKMEIVEAADRDIFAHLEMRVIIDDEAKKP